MRHAIDMIGARAGSLTVIERAAQDTNNPKAQARWLCRCECGQTCIRAGYALRRDQAHMCADCLARVHAAIAASAQPAGAASRRGKGRPSVEVACQACGLIGRGHRWLTAHRQESPECNRRRLVAVRRWGDVAKRATAEGWYDRAAGEPVKPGEDL